MIAELDALVLAHRDLVRQLALRAAKILPACVELDDLISIGTVALCEKALAYDARLHPNFEVFARKRVYGAMIDAYRDRNYPRQYESMPDHWTRGEMNFVRSDGDLGGNRHCGPMPESLIDPQPLPDELVIVAEEETHVIVSITEARRQLTRAEGRAVDLHLAGEPMRRIGRKAGRGKRQRSGAWASYTVKRAKAKLRKHLDDDRLKAA